MVSSVLASKRGGPAGSLACHRRSRASGSARTCTCAHSGQFGRRQVIDGAVGSLLLLPDLRTHRAAIAAEDPVAESPADVAAEAAPSDSPPLEADPSAAPVVEDLALTGPPPASWNVVEDVYDQYTIVLPQDWSQVTTAGYDLSFRNIRNVEQNMFIELSSKSFSKFRSLPQDFGSPDECAQIWLKKYLEEFTSTRLGIQRSGRVIATMERKNEQDGGRLYYDLLLNIDSYAARNQYGITQAERKQSLEWDRYFLTTIGIQGERLFELRLQCAKQDWIKGDSKDLLTILRSFKLVASDLPVIDDKMRGKKRRPSTA